MRFPIKKAAIIFAVSAFSLHTIKAAEPASQPVQPVQPIPTKAQLAWQNAEIGVMFHYDPRIFAANGQNYQTFRKPLKNAAAFAQKFAPRNLDTDQWIATAKAMGAKFAILVVKHESGFCLWQSDANPYSLKMLKWRNGKADILRDFVASCKKYGLKPGVFTDSRWDMQLAVMDGKVTKASPLTQTQYNRMIEKEVKELCTRYGPLIEIWFDGGYRTPAQGGPNVLPIVEKYQPNAILYPSTEKAGVRWGGTESGTVPYPCWATVKSLFVRGTKSQMQHGDPDGKFWTPAMADTPFRCNGLHDWFWVSGHSRGIAPLARLQKMYENSVGHNATLMIGLTLNTDGVIPKKDAARCKEFGDWLRKTFESKPLAETSGTGNELTLKIPFGESAPVKWIVLMENIANGERIRSYVVDAEESGKWKPVAEGSCIGHKRIQSISPCSARKFRLRVLKSNDTPQILKFSVR